MPHILSISIGLLLLALLITIFFWFKHYRELLQLREKFIAKDDELKMQQARAEQFKEEIKTTFSSMAQEALKDSNQEFLKLAELTLSKHQQLAENKIDQKKSEINNIIDPLKLSLNQFHQEVSTMEKERQRSYALVENELKKVIENNKELSQETRALKDALKKPHVRGRWGELQLKNCVELAGMSEYADVQFQDVNDNEGKKLIPDMTVKMPGRRLVVVDAKTPIDAFLESMEATTDEKRNLEMARHGRQVKDHVVKLSRKAYGDFLNDSADFTVMFLPNESFLYAALETQPDLVEFALDKKILIATPPTFVGLLKVIRFGWNEERMTQNAEEIAKMGQELHKRVVDFLEAYDDIGKNLKQAQDKYDVGLKRLNSRIIPQAKRMEKLGAKSHKELPQVEH